MNNHWRKENGIYVCDCPVSGKCGECGKDCTDHDLIGNQVELGFPVYWCSECVNRSWKEYEKNADKRTDKEESERSSF